MFVILPTVKRASRCTVWLLIFWTPLTRISPFRLEEGHLRRYLLAWLSKKHLHQRLGDPKAVKHRCLGMILDVSVKADRNDETRALPMCSILLFLRENSD